MSLSLSRTPSSSSADSSLTSDTRSTSTDSHESTFSLRPESLSSVDSDDGLDHLSTLLSTLDYDSHPFSNLNELVQKGALGDLRYTDQGPSSSGWSARVSVGSESLGRLSAEYNSGSKQLAKRLAAQVLLTQIVARTSSIFLSPRPANKTAGTIKQEPTQRLAHLPVLPPPPATLQITKKQSRALAKADSHRRVIQQLALSRGIEADQTTYLCVDVEVYEHGKEILEVGLAWIFAGASCSPTPQIQCRHLVVEDHLHLCNGQHVLDNRHNFNFGESEFIKEEALAATMAAALRACAAAGGPVVLVGHSIHHDVDWLRLTGVKFELLTCDIGQAYQSQSAALQLSSLEKMITAFGITPRHLHNGGNDAFYSLAIFLKMMDVEEQTMCLGPTNEQSLLCTDP